MIQIYHISSLTANGLVPQVNQTTLRYLLWPGHKHPRREPLQETQHTTVVKALCMAAESHLALSKPLSNRIFQGTVVSSLNSRLTFPRRLHTHCSGT